MSAIRYIRVLVCLIGAGAVFVASSFGKPVDIKFPVLEINSRSYTNVTITTVERDFICLIHARGMESIRVVELPAELRQQLGCDSIPLPVKVEAPARVSDGTEKVFDDKNLVFAYMETWWYKMFSGGVPTEAARTWLIATLLFIWFVVHLVRSICARVICRKTEVDASFVVWFPKAQWYYLYRAAGMSGGWALFILSLYILALIPGVNRTPQFAILFFLSAVILFFVDIAWCIKIARVLGKNPVCILIIAFPLFEIIGWLYLAIDAKEKEEKVMKPKRESMTLETA
jgi:hypothetical protein